MGTEVAVEGNIAVEVAAGSLVVDSQAAAGSPVVVGSLADKPAAVEDSHCHCMAAEGFVEDMLDFVVDSRHCSDKDCTVGFDCTAVDLLVDSEGMLTVGFAGKGRVVRAVGNLAVEVAAGGCTDFPVVVGILVVSELDPRRYFDSSAAVREGVGGVWVTV